VAHAVCAGIGLASLPRSMFEESAFTDVLCPVLTEHPLRQPHLYAIYASRKYLPLKLRSFVDHLIADPYTTALGHRGDSLRRHYFAGVELHAISAADPAPEFLSTTFLWASGYAELKEQRHCACFLSCRSRRCNAGGFRNGDRRLCKIHCRKGLGLEGPGI
jgi:hypothetical protein